eukprot:jgi/Chlat1/8533/Chrsp82S07938
MTAGDITFDEHASIFTPSAFPVEETPPMIAPTVRRGQAGWFLCVVPPGPDRRHLHPRQEVQTAFPSQSEVGADAFSAEAVLLATWVDAVVAFNCDKAFSCFYYNKLQWDVGDFYGGANGVDCQPGWDCHHAQAGCNLGDGVVYASLPGSETPEIRKLTEYSNTGQVHTHTHTHMHLCDYELVYYAKARAHAHALTGV